MGRIKLQSCANAEGLALQVARFSDGASVTILDVDDRVAATRFQLATNPIESTFATVRHRTKVTKGPGSGAAGLAMAFKLIEAAQARWRAVNAPHLVALVRAGATFHREKLIDRPVETTTWRRRHVHEAVHHTERTDAPRKQPPARPRDIGPARLRRVEGIVQDEIIWKGSLKFGLGRCADQRLQRPFAPHTAYGDGTEMVDLLAPVQ